MYTHSSNAIVLKRKISHTGAQLISKQKLSQSVYLLYFRLSLCKHEHSLSILKK